MFALLIASIFIVSISGLLGVSIWVVHQIDQILTGIFLPGYMILNTADMKNYAKKTTTNMMATLQRKHENMNLYGLHFFRHFHANARQIRPIV